MKKWVCPVCGYVHEGDNPPEKCPVCKVAGERFALQEEKKEYASEHVLGVGKIFPDDVPEDVRERIIEGLRCNFEGECREVGMYLAAARVAEREGYSEIGQYWEKAAYEEAEHAAKFAELLGEVISDSTKKNLEMRIEAERGATEGKTEIAKLAKKYNLDAVHDAVHEMARDEARHGRAFEGLLRRYFSDKE
jgi:rubrerythrin